MVNKNLRKRFVKGSGVEEGVDEKEKTIIEREEGKREFVSSGPARRGALGT